MSGQFRWRDRWTVLPKDWVYVDLYATNDPCWCRVSNNINDSMISVTRWDGTVYSVYTFAVLDWIMCSNIDIGFANSTPFDGDDEV